MKKISSYNIKRLELISIKLEKIPKENTNSIIKDLKWLTKELRNAYLIIEKISK